MRPLRTLLGRACLLAAVAPAFGRPAAGPNVVLIVADDQRPDAVEGYRDARDAEERAAEAG